MPTAATIIGLARDVVRAESTSDAPVIGDSFMLSAITDGNLRWARVFRRGQPLVFQRETGFDLIADTALSDDQDSADLTASLESVTGFPATGAFIVWDDNMPDIQEYSALVALDATVSGVGFDHEEGDSVQLLYQLPANFGSFRESPTYGDGVSLNGIPLLYINGFPVPGRFSMYDNGTDKFLILPRGSTGSVSVLYNKVSATIDTTDDIVDVPEEYQYFLVWHLVAFSYIGREGDVNKMLFAQDQANKILQEALSHRNTGKKIRTRSFGRPVRDYISSGGNFYPINS